MLNSLIILGCRGSVPCSGKQYTGYGTATTCFALRMGGKLIFIDAGTGLLNCSEYMSAADKSADILMTHSHADHVMGLPLCGPALDKDFEFNVYLKTRGEFSAKEQIEAYLSEPTWPVGTDKLPAKFSFFDMPEEFKLGDITVKAMDCVHPGGCSMLRIEGCGKTIVIATDAVLKPGEWDAELEFAKGADILIADGQYSPAEFKEKYFFGHSSWVTAAEFGRECGAARTIIVHHDPFRSDAKLDAAAEEIKMVNHTASLGREGEVIEL